MSLNTLVGHHLLGAAVTHTLLPETGYAATRLGRKIRFSIVALIISALLWRELPDDSETLYGMVGLPTNATQYNIVTQHSKIKAEMQDNASMENADKIKEAFQILMNEEKRRGYDRFGDVQSSLFADADLHVVATVLSLAFHALSCIMCIAFFSSNQFALSRYFMFLYSAIAFALEMECRFVKNSSFFKNIYYVNELLPFQQVALMRRIAPSVALLLNLVCAYFFVDMDKFHLFLWHSAVSTNRAIIEKMTDVVDATNYVRTLPSHSTAGLRTPTSPAQKVMWHFTAQVPHDAIVDTPQAGGSDEEGKSEGGKSSGSSSKSANAVKEILDSMNEVERQKIAELLKITSSNRRPANNWYSVMQSSAVLVGIFLVVKYCFG
ncbi:DnaJ domain containing protein, putative [Babesia bigemina]|uniref:DnaJ domain containing protein, putative n=1 Tax=Babesia bigemina TaxID=5866 RepID=A0A061D240_BABBI|nr:DnaJ domain containing protein, putative [Babesia bigemina]CDR94806.1 DnaJ domain containing protein, putative [Babesia bigemina]|eukprot:XP_012766992.1 DnaJ domain containing protein, putative [Babesia bigemina]